ncbi:hypothetical protein BCR44DRAFT_1445704 [Catenaria anguillulae PL171]|uniref:Uncharacterized protein n=1 Tax=Catenaria anguillulae PL171 TaxID=765915 RepID=A0A1Y2H6V0_9FUNG|nr:hypothetical protein BCR44DRAFT_1445704 [Catenaria anguillulae PL171]
MDVDPWLMIGPFRPLRRERLHGASTSNTKENRRNEVTIHKRFLAVLADHQHDYPQVEASSDSFRLLRFRQLSRRIRGCGLRTH